MRFDPTLFQTGNTTGIEVPPEVVEHRGGGKRPAVLVNVNGFEYRNTIAVMGGRYLIAFSSDKRAATGLTGGDPIVVELTLDTAPRTVEVPDDLAAALATDPGAAQAFESMAYTHRKEYVRWVSEARREQTRLDRIAATVDMVRQGRTR